MVNVFNIYESLTLYVQLYGLLPIQGGGGGGILFNALVHPSSVFLQGGGGYSKRRKLYDRFHSLQLYQFEAPNATPVLLSFALHISKLGNSTGMMDIFLVKGRAGFAGVCI